MNGHDHFEELCALAASGLASEEEFRELEFHLRDCEDCRGRVPDFALIGGMIGGMIGGLIDKKIGETSASRRPPAGMTNRFVERALAEGIPLARPAPMLPAWLSRRSLARMGTIAAGVLLGVLITGSLWRISAFRRQPRHSSLAILSALPSPAGREAVPAPHLDGEQVKRLQAEIEAATGEKKRLEQTLAGVEERLKTETSHEAGLASDLAALESEKEQLQQASSEKDAHLADLDSQLQKRQSSDADAIAALAEKQMEVQTLQEALDKQEAELREQRQLLAAGSQARDLIVARNLHIIDVHDNDGSGERQRAFGRIFYTEGKSLIFYAYDLEDPEKLNKKVAFYVWGGKLGDQNAVRNLGIFRSEDANAGRWVLTFDDPHILAQINTVFVTAESKKAVERPDGKRILFAFLNSKPNHP